MHALTMTVGLPTEDSARAARWYGMRWRPTSDLRPPPPRGGFDVARTRDGRPYEDELMPLDELRFAL